MFHVGKAKIEKMSYDLKVNYELLDSAMTTVMTDFILSLLLSDLFNLMYYCPSREVDFICYCK